MANAPQTEQPGVKGWIEYRLPIFSALDATLVSYPTPRNLNYWWNFGSIAGIMLVSQILTGIFLAMHYAANTAIGRNAGESSAATRSSSSRANVGTSERFGSGFGTASAPTAAC